MGDLYMSIRLEIKADAAIANKDDGADVRRLLP